jgi:hypothetical protein
MTTVAQGETLALRPSARTRFAASTGAHDR